MLVVVVVRAIRAQEALAAMGEEGLVALTQVIGTGTMQRQTPVVEEAALVMVLAETAAPASSSSDTSDEACWFVLRAFAGDQSLH